MAILKSRTWFCPRQRVAHVGSPCPCNTLNQRQGDSKEGIKNGVECRFAFGMVKNKRVPRLSLTLRCCCKCNHGGSKAEKDSTWFEEEEEDKFVKIMREVQPYIHAHRGSTFVLLLSAEIVDSSYLPSILEVTKLLSLCNSRCCPRIG